MEIGVPRIRARFPTHTTQDTVRQPFTFFDVTVTLCGLPFQASLKKVKEVHMTVRRPHFLIVSEKDSV